MYAVIETGGKQYRVQAGDVFNVEKLKVSANDKIEFDRVLAYSDGKEVKLGTPILEGVKVIANVIENGKGDKVIIFKYKAKKDYRKKQGHRQPYTQVEVKGFLVDGVEVIPTVEKKEAKPKKAVAKPKAEKAEAGEEKTAKTAKVEKAETGEAKPKKAAAKPKAEKAEAGEEKPKKAAAKPKAEKAEAGEEKPKKAAAKPKAEKAEAGEEKPKKAAAKPKAEKVEEAPVKEAEASAPVAEKEKSE